MTLKANELRIGNYLNGKQGHVIITEIRENNIVKIHDNTSIFYVGTCLKPIPLTEEWLFKFGFIEKIDAYFYNDYCIEDIHNRVTWVINEFDHITDEFTAIGCGINYVHQLQNLYFALTNEELTLKNNSNN